MLFFYYRCRLGFASVTLVTVCIATMTSFSSYCRYVFLKMRCSRRRADNTLMTKPLPTIGVMYRAMHEGLTRQECSLKGLRGRVKKREKRVSYITISIREGPGSDSIFVSSFTRLSTVFTDFAGTPMPDDMLTQSSLG